MDNHQDIGGNVKMDLISAVCNITMIQRKTLEATGLFTFVQPLNTSQRRQNSKGANLRHETYMTNILQECVAI